LDLLFAVALRRTLWWTYISAERFTGAQRLEHDATPAVTVCWYTGGSGNYSTVPTTVSNVPIREWNRIECGSKARSRDSTGNKIMLRGGILV